MFFPNLLSSREALATSSGTLATQCEADLRFYFKREGLALRQEMERTITGDGTCLRHDTCAYPSFLSSTYALSNYLSREVPEGPLAERFQRYRLYGHMSAVLELEAVRLALDHRLDLERTVSYHGDAAPVSTTLIGHEEAREELARALGGLELELERQVLAWLTYPGFGLRNLEEWRALALSLPRESDRPAYSHAVARSMAALTYEEPAYEPGAVAQLGAEIVGYL